MSHCAPVQPMQAKEAYRLWAPEYDTTLNPLLSLEQRCMAPMIRAAAGCDAVDLGCGTGRWLAQLAEIGARSVIGIDVCEEMLQLAAKKLPSSARLILSDCQSTPLATESSNWIQASFLLSYVEDLQGFAYEAARIAEPGAVVLLSDVHPATRGFGWKRNFSCAHQVIEIRTQPYEISDLHCAMDRAGFEPIHFLEFPFGEQERAIFFEAGRPDLFERVKGLAALFIAGYRRRGLMKLHAEMASIVELPRAHILYGARVAIDPWHTVRAALLVRCGKIEAIFPDAKSAQWVAPFARMIDLKGHLILPGLVNAHDHLHFGVFPRLGQGPYPSWREWAKDIYHPEEPPLRALLEIPKEERLWWGIVRNALSGVTTVCHHDPAHSMLTSGELPVTVHPRFGWAHSLDGRTWKERYAQTPIDWPFIVHCAEGLNPRSRSEVAKIDREGKLNHRMVLVHAVGINKRDLSKLKTGGAWIVWCPTSNLHILGRTLDRDLLLSYPFIALGSDSPISASGDLLDELQVAYKQFDIPADLLYAMVTRRAAQLLRLTEREGSISAGGVADLLIVRDKDCSPCETLATLNRDDLAAVMHKGEFTVASEEFYTMQEGALSEDLIPMDRHGLSWHIAAPPGGLSIRPEPPCIEPVYATQTELTKQ